MTEIPEMLRGLFLYENDPKLCREFPVALPAWKRAFPNVDIAAEVAKAHAWEMSNSTKRKRERIRFIQAWLNRTSERNTAMMKIIPGVAPAPPLPPPTRYEEKVNEDEVVSGDMWSELKANLKKKKCLPS